MSLPALVLTSFVWSGLVWCGAHTLCRFNPSPKQAQAIWRSGAILMLVPFLAAPFLPGLSRGMEVAIPNLPMLDAAIFRPVDAMGPIKSDGSFFQMPSLGQIILGILCLGWGVRLALWLASQARLQSVKRLSKPSSFDASVWAKSLGISPIPSVRLTQSGSPFVAGLARLVVFVPEGLDANADARQVIAHECVHLKRGDLITRPLERLVADLFWFSPFAWGMRHALDYWREAVVDTEASRLTGDRIAYARALTRVARLSRPVINLPVAAFILTRKGSLKMRLTHLLNDQPRHPKRMAAAATLAIVLAVPMALAQGVLMKGETAKVSVTHPVLTDPEQVAETLPSGGCRVESEMPVTTEAWKARMKAAQDANRQAGLNLASDWLPETIAWPRPSYPVDAVARLASGNCLVMFDLQEDGRPANMLAECSDPVFEASAAELPDARFEHFVGTDGSPAEVKGVVYPLQYCIK